jgi:hypothetical protein
MMIRLWLVAAALPALAAAQHSAAPRPAPAAFVSEQYGLTFKTATHSLYCRLPKDWVGSDHGTVVFLAAPKRCYGAGFPSSGRGFDGNVARIEIFYAYAVDDDDEGAPEPCISIGRVRFLAHDRPLCKAAGKGHVEISVSARYMADIRSQAVFTLVTTSGRLQRDLAAFRSLVSSARTCTAAWRDGKGGVFTTGAGSPCPKEARFF